MLSVIFCYVNTPTSDIKQRQKADTDCTGMLNIQQQEAAEQKDEWER